MVKPGKRDTVEEVLRSVAEGAAAFRRSALEQLARAGGFGEMRKKFVCVEYMRMVAGICAAYVENVFARMDRMPLSEDAARVVTDSFVFGVHNGASLDFLDLAVRTFTSPEHGALFPAEVRSAAAAAAFSALVSNTFEQTRFREETECEDDENGDEPAFEYVEDVHSPLGCSLYHIGSLIVREPIWAASELRDMREMFDRFFHGLYGEFLVDFVLHEDTSSSAKEFAAVVLLSPSSEARLREAGGAPAENGLEQFARFARRAASADGETERGEPSET